MRYKITKFVNSFKRLPLPMQLIILAAIIATTLAALSIKAYQRYTTTQQQEKQTLWPHMNGGKPPNQQMLRYLSGKWVYETGTRRAELRIAKEGIFQLIIRRKDIMTRRFYVRGFVSVGDHTLYLRQDARFGRPFVQGKPYIRFTPMNMRELAVDFKIDRQGRRLVWRFSGTEPTRDIQNLLQHLAGKQVRNIEWYKTR